jgi:hypothetical protein
VQKSQASRGVVFFVVAWLALLAYVPLVWRSEPIILILILGFDETKELGAQACHRQFYYSRYVRNGH